MTGYLRIRWIANAACGTNYGAQILEQLVGGADVVGFDRDESALQIAKKRPSTQAVECCDLEVESFYGYDALVCIETLEHLNDPVAFLQRFDNRLKYMIVSVPIIPTKHRNKYHLHDFTKSQMDEMLTGLGWKIDAYWQQLDDVGMWSCSR